LLGLNATFALYIVGPVLGGVIVATTSAANLPQRHVLIAIIGLWAVYPIVLAFVGNLTVAMIVFGLGGLVWAPFTPSLTAPCSRAWSLTSNSRSSRFGQPAQWWPPRLALWPEAH
jgi:hypothetical protein